MKCKKIPKDSNHTGQNIIMLLEQFNKNNNMKFKKRNLGENDSRPLVRNVKKKRKEKRKANDCYAIHF